MKHHITHNNHNHNNNNNDNNINNTINNNPIISNNPTNNSNSPSVRIQILSAFSYAMTSVCILIFNKQVLTNYKFNYPVVMTLFHMLICLGLLSALKSRSLLNYSSFDFTLAKKVFPLSACFVGNIVIGMCALRLTNIPMFATLRRLTQLFVIISEYMLLNKKPTPLIGLSIFIMISGSLIGGWGDLQFDLLGYFYVILNNVITALYLTLIKRTINDTKLKSDTFGLMYYNSLISAPFLFVICVLNGELIHLFEFPYLFDPGFQFSFTVSAAMSFGVNYTTFWCTEVNSPLTTSVTGQVKNVLSSFISILGPFSPVKATPLLVLGLCVGLLGSFLYAAAMSIQNRKNNQNQNQNNKNNKQISNNFTQINQETYNNDEHETLLSNPNEIILQDNNNDTDIERGNISNTINNNNNNNNHINNNTIFTNSQNTALLNDPNTNNNNHISNSNNYYNFNNVNSFNDHSSTTTSNLNNSHAHHSNPVNAANSKTATIKAY